MPSKRIDLKTNIVHTAFFARHFQTQVTAVDATNLVDALRKPGSFATFAPLDQAFTKSPEGSLEYLLENIPALAKLLTYLAEPTEIRIDHVIGQSVATLVKGQSVKITKTEEMLFVSEAKIFKVTPVENGATNVIDTVLLPF